MKKLISVILVLVTVLSLSSCADLSEDDFYETYAIEVSEGVSSESPTGLSTQSAGSNLTATTADSTEKAPQALVTTGTATIATEAAPQTSPVTEAAPAVTEAAPETEADTPYYPSNGNEALVWIPTNGGTKHHMTSTCSKMKDPIQVTKSEALARGFEACKRCYN